MKTNSPMNELLEYLKQEKAELAKTNCAGENGGWVIVFRNSNVPETVYSLAKDIINLISSDAQDISPFTPINRVRVFKMFSDAREYWSAHRTIQDGKGRFFNAEIDSLESYRHLLLRKCEQEEEVITRWVEEFKYNTAKK